MNASIQIVPPTPGAVPVKATPPGDKAHPPEVTVRMSIGSCMIWTQRMLQALERGNDGRKWHTLIDKVYATANLRLALSTVTQCKTSPGIDGRSAGSVARDAEAEVATLERLLREGKYEPQPVKRVWIDSLRSPLRGSTVCCLSRSARLFDSIPHDRLMALVRERVADGRLLALIESFLKQQIMNSMGWIETEEHDEGTPQGGVICFGPPHGPHPFGAACGWLPRPSVARFWQTSTSIHWTT